MKEGLKEEGFVGVGRKEREWGGWMEGEKEGVREMGEEVKIKYLEFKIDLRIL